MKNTPVVNYYRFQVKRCLQPTEWNPDAIIVDYVKEGSTSYLDTKEMTILANRSSISYIIQENLQLAETKFKARAFLQWYSKYGIEEEEFLAAFERNKEILKSYSEI